MRKSSEIINDHVKTLEEMIDIMDDLWEAERQGKWRAAENARLELYNAKQMYKDYLDEYIDRRIKTYIETKEGKQ
ncbi:hypothetical protein UFOVP245_52 [uncultured Caudovirales phage]|uniref:Uncharacterized protein n=1 Tax=uncultured Caudovirales phage TaxID=2100421 RepID=A0A6J7WW88_9CAUD|nr:hypothetical protein UFOVP245_52 [uncultured Caudovirales phage]